MDHLCYLCLVFVMLSRLFIAALWSPAGKGLISYVQLCFCHFTMWYPESGVVLDVIDSWSLPPFLLCDCYIRRDMCWALFGMHACIYWLCHCMCFFDKGKTKTMKIVQAESIYQETFHQQGHEYDFSEELF